MAGYKKIVLISVLALLSSSLLLSSDQRAENSDLDLKNFTKEQEALSFEDQEPIDDRQQLYSILNEQANEITDLSGHIAFLDNQIQILRYRNTILEGNRDFLSQQLENRSSDLEEKRKEYLTLMKERNNLIRQNRTLQGNVDTVLERIRQLPGGYDMYGKLCETLPKENPKLKRIFNKINQEEKMIKDESISSLHQEINNRETIISDLMREISQLKTNPEEKQRSDALRAKLKKSSAARKVLRREKAAITEQAAIEITDLEQERIRITDLLEKSTREKKHLQASHAILYSEWEKSVYSLESLEKTANHQQQLKKHYKMKLDRPLTRFADTVHDTAHTTYNLAKEHKGKILFGAGLVAYATLWHYDRAPLQKLITQSATAYISPVLSPYTQSATSFVTNNLMTPLKAKYTIASASAYGVFSGATKFLKENGSAAFNTLFPKQI